MARCDTNSKWVISDNNLGTYFADLTYDTTTATGDGCKDLAAYVEDDLDFDIGQDDFEQANGRRFQLLVATGPNELTMMGEHQAQGAVGPFTISLTLLNATTVVTSYEGRRAVIEHRAIGPCGVRCYLTRSTWIATDE
ncbi:MAG TPA: hypothetical protein VF529_15340 [Solirubrobacteraceae bacterium]